MKDSGFTIIELAIVTAIIAIVAALAVPIYSMFKSQALDSTAAVDARNVAPAAELVAAVGGLSDPITIDGTGGPIPGLPGAIASPGTMLFIIVGPNSYFIEAEHPGGTLRYQLDSDVGWTVLDG